MGLVNTVARTAIQHAAETFGARMLDCEQVSAGRTDVFRVRLSSDLPYSNAQERLPTGHNVVAARVVPCDAGEISPVTDHRAGHQLVHALAARGVRVAAPLHPQPIATPAGLITFWEWLTPASAQPAADWGRLTAHLHTTGTDTARALNETSIGTYDPWPAFAPRLKLATEHTARPGHPLHANQTVLRTFEAALEVAVGRAREVAAGLATVLTHGDNQPGNVLRTLTGSTVLTDFERLAWGPAALDWSALLLGRWHYGFTTHHAQDFHHAYASQAPVGDLDEALTYAQPFARIRELSGVLVAMLAAGDSGRWEREMYARLPAITDAGFGTRWTFIGRRTDMRLTNPSPSTPAPEWKEVPT